MAFSDTVKKFIPSSLSHLITRIKYEKAFHRWVKFWERRDLIFCNGSNSKESLEYNIISTAHVLEKGIAMPNRRYGFGYDKVRTLLRQLTRYEEEYSTLDCFGCLSALDTLGEYYQIHQDAGFALPKDIDLTIATILKKYAWERKERKTFFSKEQFFGSFDSFTSFAGQRHSVRNFSDKEIDIDLIIDAIRVAQMAPSACNRQSTRVKIFASKEMISKMLDLQNGSRGFGHLANKLLLITADQYAWELKYRTSAFLDAGIFIMNLLYALHERGICACTLNAHFDQDKLKAVWNSYCPQNEVPVAVIILGMPLDQFQVVYSERRDVKDVVEVIR